AEEDPLSHARRGLTLLKQQRYAEARASLLHAAALDSSLHEAAYGLGLAAARTGDLAGSVAYFAEAARLSPTSASAQLNLGVAYAKLDKFDEAARAYARAVELDPANGRGHLYLSDAYQQLGHLQKSRAHREKARQLAHESP
ncbi:MAG: tetratricopeptide repeat protein, partial [Gemmatimonadetes bacterium]|nr:tetratricopeptide repeat protein [Gemmatimonadota bacterium]